MALMIRCPLTGLSCGKPIDIKENTFFLSETEKPTDANDRRNIALKEALGNKFKIRSAILEKQPIAFNCKICEMIQSCAYGIADITGQNPNVLLELGMLLALGKPTIILCKKGEEGLLQLPSNVNAIEVIPFEDYIDIIGDVRQIATSLPPPVMPSAPLEDTQKVLQEFNPQLAKDIKNALDEHKITLVGEFEKVIKEAKLDTTVSEKERKEIPAMLEDRLAKLEESLQRFEKLGFTSDVETAFYRGNYYHEKQEYEAALYHYSWSLILRPDYHEALNNRGITYHKMERYDEALADLNRALELRPDFPEVLNNRGATYSKMERYKEALADLNRAIELIPDYSGAFNNRGITYHKMERYDEALADYNRALELRPDFPEVLCNRGLTYSKKERYEDALADYNRALELKPDYPEALNNRGVTYLKLKHYRDALADYNRALELRPDYPGAIYNLACLFSLTDRTDDAISHLEKAIRLEQKSCEMAKTDSDFDNIRDDPRFRRLIEGT